MALKKTAKFNLNKTILLLAGIALLVDSAFLYFALNVSEFLILIFVLIAIVFISQSLQK